MADRCPHCGVKIEAGSAKCGFCGAPTDIQGGDPPQFPPTPALYDRGYLLWLSFISTPAVGSWCSWRNAKAMGHQRMEKVAFVSMLIFSALTIMSIVVSCILLNMPDDVEPDAARGLAVLVNLIQWIAYYFIVHKPLADHIKKYDITCRRKSCFLPVLLCIAWIIIAVIVGYMCAANG